MKREIYNRYISLGFQVIELKTDKTPKRRRYNKDGSVSRLSDEYKDGSVYGVVPPKTIMIIDVDKKNGAQGFRSLEKLRDDLLLDYNFEPTVITGSGGWHIYVKCDKNVKVNQKSYPGIDFISHKISKDVVDPYVVAGEQTLKKDGEDYVYSFYLEDKIKIYDIKVDWDEVLTLETTNFNDNDLNINISDLYDKKKPEDIEELLLWLNADDYHNWIDVCSAIRNEIEDEEEALKLFIKFSKQSDKFDLKETKKKFESIKSNYAGNKRTYGSLYYEAVENKRDKLIQEIGKVESKQELIELLKKEIWTDGFILPKKILATDIVRKIQSLDLEIGYHQAMALMRPLFKKQINEIETINKIKKDDKIINIRDFVKVFSYTRQPYYCLKDNSRHNVEDIGMVLQDDLIEISKQLKLKKTITIQEAYKKGLIDYAVDTEYNPTTNDRIFINDIGQRILNTFDKRTLPIIAKEISVQGAYYIDLFIKHINYMFDEDEANIFLDFLSYITQNLGKKVIWVPLLQSAEGIGKSIIGTVMVNHILGEANAGTIDPIAIIDTNNSWATGKMLRILEELKLNTGNTRYDVINNFKPLITNLKITRKEKFEVTSEVKNTCNFIAFTNHLDGIPHIENDRRWWIVHSKLKSIEDLEEISGKDRDSYFKPLHKFASKDCEYGAEFKKFLLDRQISSNFNPNFPPISKHKAKLLAIENAKITNFDEVIILFNCLYGDDTPKVVNMAALIEASRNATDNKGRRLTNDLLRRDIKKVFDKLGYKVVTKTLYPELKKYQTGGHSNFFYLEKEITIENAIKEWELRVRDLTHITIDFEEL